MNNNQSKTPVEASYYFSTEEIEMAEKLGMNLRRLVQQAHHPIQGKTFPEFIRYLYGKRFEN